MRMNQNGDLKTATKETIKHYGHPDVRETILRVSNIGESSRWMVGDKTGWYTKARQHTYAVPAISQKYSRTINKFRTLHSTLSFFHPGIFGVEMDEITKEEAKIRSKNAVMHYTFGIDIDSVDPKNGHGANIHDPEVKEAVEAMAQFFADRLRGVSPNSVYVAYSGGGIYVFVHHGVFDEYFKKFAMSTGSAYRDMVDTLTISLNFLIDDLSKEFYAEFPQHEKYVKADCLNGAKRVFKSVFSIHKKFDYAVIPLDPENVEIDFDAARIPLSEDVISRGKTWYMVFDDDNAFLIFLKPWLEKAQKRMSEKAHRRMWCGGGVRISDTPFLNSSEYPPCAQNVLNMSGCGPGATRALAFLAAFLGQIGVPEEEAREIWYDLAGRWGAATANVFESWFRKMNCPSCRTIRTPGPGYPYVDLANLNACKPDMKCMSIDFSNPVYYVDKAQYIEKIKHELLSMDKPTKPTGAV